VLKGTFLYEQSCKDYLLKNPNLKGVDSPQTIHPLHYNGEPFDVFCDMTTEGGGWTVATMIADPKTKNIFNTSNTEKILSLKDNISSKGKINNIWTDNKDKDIMIKCFTTNLLFREYEKPFIIFSFTQKDLINLVKEDIAGTTFSSKKLNASYDGKRYLLQDEFGGSSVTTTMRIQTINNENMYYHNKGEFLKCRTQLGKKSICHDNDILQFSEKNYCITAIR
ncbi:MAG: fibrinogen-like YCDxxxxGGGW domain-containing protein, partial [Candidatus Absconditabacteria bacterium]